MEDLKASRAQREFCYYDEEESVEEFLELENETYSRGLLTESETVNDPEPTYDAELALTRYPSIANPRTTQDRAENELPAVHQPTPEVISQVDIALILDEIEKDLLDENSDDDGPNSDEAGSSRVRNQHVNVPSSTSIRASGPMANALPMPTLAVSIPRVGKQKIPAAG